MNLSLKLSAARGPAAKAETLQGTRKAATRYPEAVFASGARPRGDHEPGPSALDRDVLATEGGPPIRTALRQVVSVKAESH